ncbi:MAG: hypothetical protein LBJ73_02260 [Rickettsiales bacterium]|jgi:hypothetical protein|nr:hypothetical protein [Rickettsiales bacterium]
MLSAPQTFYDKDPTGWFDWWNSDLMKYQSNCYSYAIGYPWTYFNLGTIINPGFRKNPYTVHKEQTIGDFANALVGDGLTFIKTDSIRDLPKLESTDYYLTAVFTTLVDCPGLLSGKQLEKFAKEKPFRERATVNYHIARQHDDGRWSGRNGAEGKVDFCMMSENGQHPAFCIIDGRPAFFVGYYSVPKSGLDIGIPRQLSDLSEKQLKDPRLLRHPKIIDALLNFNMDMKIEHFENTRFKYLEIMRNFVKILHHESGGWQADILNSLMDAHKTKWERMCEKILFLR